MVLAGGRGRSLEPLTRDRAKAAIPFGGQYRLIDVALSNLVNGGYRQIVVLTQYKSQSLNRHLAKCWQMSPLLGDYIAAVPPQMRRGEHFFQGPADALYQNFNLVRDADPDHVVVFSADHMYRFDPRQMVNAHIDSGAGVTVVGTRMPVDQAGSFGVIRPGRDGRIATYVEPQAPPRVSGDARFQDESDVPMPLDDDPGWAFASMGSYVFSTRTLIEAMTADAHDAASDHQIGDDVLPRLVASGDAHLYDFSTNDVPGSTERDRNYWRDVDTLDAFHDMHMDLVDVDPVFNLYNRDWPLYTWNEPAPPAKFLSAEAGPPRASRDATFEFDHEGRRGVSYDSMVSQGVIVAGGTVRRSVLSPGVRVGSYSLIEESVLMHGVTVGRHAVIRRAIVDKYVDIPDGAQIGVDLQRDRGRFRVTDRGIVVIGRGDKVDP
jgi:glucose-1-phosphate adenylyltransferase